MNRLILIGNGFDLAHRMETSYSNFMTWYLKKAFKLSATTGLYDDIPMCLECSINYADFIGDKIERIIDKWYEEGILKNIRAHTIYLSSSEGFTNPFSFKRIGHLTNLLLDSFHSNNWVDIENSFYVQLRSILAQQKSASGKREQLITLNQELEFIKRELEEYLLTIDDSVLIPEYFNIFKSKIHSYELLEPEGFVSQYPERTMFLNFNYTKTLEKYLRKGAFRHENENLVLDSNYIHGELKSNDNPLIFGFGDELDDAYNEMEKSNLNEYYQHIKSFWYFKTTNYYDLVRFIDSEDFQVHVIGHSCGLSDRTMLNMIFEHDNCKSIKIFYHVDESGNDNYTNITQEISRHFKSKQLMRKRIVSFKRCSEMPQKN